MEGIRHHPWVNIDNESPPLSIAPKVTGIVSDSSLARTISSINHDRDFVIYSFHSIGTKQGSLAENKKELSEDIVRRKSITISGRSSEAAEVPIIKIDGGDVQELVGNPSMDEQSKAKDSLEELRGLRLSVTSRLPPLPKEEALADTANGKLKPVSRARAATTGGHRPVIKTNAETLNPPKPKEELSTTPESATNRRSSFLKPESAENSADAKSAEIQGRRRSTSFSAKASALLRKPSFGPGNASHRPTEEAEPDVDPSEERSSVVMRRMSMVSPSNDDQQSPKSPTNVNVEMKELQEWHQMHKPPKSIRTLKFAFNAAASSSTLDAATMFQDLHKVLVSLKEYHTKQLTFTRNEEFYIFHCTCKNQMFTDDLQFDIEICKVWLMNMHALKMKKRKGNAFYFKDIHDRILHGLKWSK
jgi:hypothetical protein